MENPYEVLGIKENASDAEVKAAYREQVKKYHPDKYQDNPLQDLAQEKLREVNEAYDTIMEQRKNGWSGDSYSDNGNGGGAARRMAPEFRQVRKDLDNGSLDAAERTLNGSRNRSAEWYFLVGILNMKKGWYDNAVSNIQTAISMDPTNTEYNNALNAMLRTSGGYRAQSYNRGYNQNGVNDELCRLCQCLICLDCMTDCM